MGGGGAAATADHLHADLQQFHYLFRHEFGSLGVEGLAVAHAGETGIGLNGDGKRAVFLEGGGDVDHLFDAVAAIGSDNGRARRFQRLCRLLDGYAHDGGKTARFFVESHGRHDRNLGGKRAGGLDG